MRLHPGKCKRETRNTVRTLVRRTPYNGTPSLGALTLENLTLARSLLHFPGQPMACRTGRDPSDRANGTKLDGRSFACCFGDWS